ncbi:MAG TPA: hypothetical protein VM049_03870 [Gaiellaceae bacterium]|nr:hypothetical protein [Gaiellaceae bacterium]
MGVATSLVVQKRHPKTVATIRCAIGPGTDYQWVAAPTAIELGAPEPGVRLTAAIDSSCVLAFRPRRDSVRLWSLNHGRRVDIPLRGAPQPLPRWARGVGELVEELSSHRRPRVGLEAVVLRENASPGFASGPALELGLALALCRAAEWEQERDDLAQIVHAARRAAGFDCRIEEVQTALAAEEGAALRLSESSAPTPASLPEETAFILAVCGDRRVSGGGHTGVRRADPPADAEERDGSLSTLGKLLLAAGAEDSGGVADGPLSVLADDLLWAGAAGVRTGEFGRRERVLAVCSVDSAPRVAAHALSRFHDAGGFEGRASVYLPAGGATFLAP